MSPGSNGISAGGPASPGPIPTEAMLHAVLLLPESEDRLARFLHALPLRTVGLLPDLAPGSWTALDQPRPCSWCDFEGNGWTFRLVFDPQGIPPALMPTVASGTPSPESLEALEEHRACCLIFLLSAPAGVPPWMRFVHLATVAWAWVDAGATLLSLPEAQLLVPRRVLLGVEPEQLSPEHGYLFLSNGLAEVQQQGEERKLWLRTWGMGQFGLPDLAAALPSRAGEEAALEADMESLRLLFETLPPAMIKEQGILPVGGTVKVGPRTWTAVGEPGAVDYPFLRSRCGVQLFV
jgi:hypothetical protein